MRNQDNEQVIKQMWHDYAQEGLEGILRWTVDDLKWRPWSGNGVILDGVEEYSTYVINQDDRGVKVEAFMETIHSDGDRVYVRGFTRTHSPDGAVQDDPLYWLSLMRDGKIAWNSSAPTVKDLLEGASLDTSVAPEIERVLS
jgi:ketosteroid isomerase-like protein